ncbi:Bax inhibitor-1/YccA family protein [Sphingomonas sp.]|uniref:Bax inhibitor-1/YccA family protein n=1 Tax=Sphingomonas sp. TaxID=28214 RepID=UPI003B001A5B
MANWSDPRSGAAPFTGTASPTRTATYDAGLRSYMLSVYNYMASGVLLTGIIAMAFAASSFFATLFNPVTGKPSLLGWIVTLAPLGIVFAMSFGQQRMATGTLKALYWAYAVLMGLSLSTIFVAYTGTSIAGAFFATAAGFAGLSLWGYTTERDLSPMGTFLLVGLIGLLVASLLAIWLPGLNPVISIVGVLIFAGLTAYDTQRIKGMYDYVAGTDQVGRTVVMSALNLYLDFINMFLFVLRLFGSSRN